MIPSLHPGRPPQHGTHGAKTIAPRTPVLTNRRWAPWVAVFALTLLVTSAVIASAGVVVTPWGPRDVREFPPGSPPTKPPLPPGEDADATPWVGWGGGEVDGTWNSADSTYTIDSLGDITLDGHTLIRVPSNADSALRAHESGHDSLNHYEYDQNAKKKVEEAMRGFVGMKFKGAGATNAEREADALAQVKAERARRMERARDAILEQMGCLSGTYDDLTDHGRSPTIDTNQGIAEAIAEHYLVLPAGLIPLGPDPSESHCGTLGEDQALFDDGTQNLLVLGSGLIHEAQFPMDPIVGRGAIRLDHFVLIGAKENGTVHLADTHVQIVDMVTGDSLLNGCLVEAAYMPSNVPGYPGMIQACLVFLPPWAHGIQNTIGSPFLAGMEAADAMGELTMAWLYSTAPLFDPLGNCLIPPEGVPLALTLGVSSSRPGAVENPPTPGRPGLIVYPQPGRGTVRFSWTPVGTPMNLEIFDASGARRWATRLDGARGEWNWQGQDADGRALRAGVYFARLHGEGGDLRARVVLVR
jgi:hypothetical protein